ncbi:hypothetical protein TOPH_09060 [Tolypocladium ophioglossoides CBS 100239]|uniref:F-box domain-containing protein n=1 Tax=Tolypocladium ophioglossoides (strain CBS 100239) TaxID=1163406 RepID=A0A0L0MWY6_TOLOC|nr:hypothetical protein TOPH_09060 [Tolypocladium ophioglossoides CBS 100239]
MGLTWKTFLINERLLDASNNISSRLLVLPTELLIRIYQHAGRLDSLCLAMTSKRLIQVAALVSLKRPCRMAHPAEAVESRSRHYVKIEGLLKRMQPLNKQGLPTRSYALCCDCLRHRPTRRSFWRAKRQAKMRASVWDGAVTCWNRRYHLQCPECWWHNTPAP